jgi:ribose transport system permease protein
MRLFSRLFGNDWSGLLVIVVVAVVLIGIAKPSFLSPFNIQILLAAVAVNMVVALAQMIIIAIGQMNLAVGAIGGLAAISFAGMMEVWGVPVPVAVLGALAIGLAAGLLNGYLVAATGISAFIITLATLAIFKGVNLGITRPSPSMASPQA